MTSHCLVPQNQLLDLVVFVDNLLIFANILLLESLDGRIHVGNIA
jgi:hypothetical protein